MAFMMIPGLFFINRHVENHEKRDLKCCMIYLQQLSLLFAVYITNFMRIACHLLYDKQRTKTLITVIV